MLDQSYIVPIVERPTQMYNNRLEPVAHNFAVTLGKIKHPPYRDLDNMRKRYKVPRLDHTLLLRVVDEPLHLQDQKLGQLVDNRPRTRLSLLSPRLPLQRVLLALTRVTVVLVLILHLLYLLHLPDAPCERFPVPQIDDQLEKWFPDFEYLGNIGEY